MTNHSYLFLSRPPGIGCQPDGDDIDKRETWWPSRNVGGFNCLGRAVWPARLSPRDVYLYTLRPESELERAELVFWDRQKNEINEWLRNNYLSQPIEKLREYAKRRDGYKARAALVILEAQADELAA